MRRSEVRVLYSALYSCEVSSVGRTPPCHGGGHEFESRTSLFIFVGVAELTDAQDLKSCGYLTVWVRSPPPTLNIMECWPSG